MSRLLVLGGYGFIGEAVCRALRAAGCEVVGLGRDVDRASLRMPFARWIAADLRQLVSAEAWTPLLAGIDVVVNAAGALQDGGRDDLDAVQTRAMLALYAAAAPAQPLIVQISANTGGPAADLPFLATKKTADEALERSGLPFVILRPALVVGRNAHGGTALLRALAAFPFGAPLARSDAPMQTVALDDVAAAVVAAVNGAIAAGSDLALAHPKIHTLGEAVALHRAWLGLAKTPVRPAPAWLTGLAGWVADLAGRLGWRSPMRSTALAVLAGGVTAARSPHEAAESAPQNTLPMALKSLEETLAAHPAGAQDLWFARLYLLKPALIAGLSLFWLASGAIALLRFGQSSAYLEAAGFGAGPAALLTLITGLADIGLGLAVLWRPFAARALIGMIGLSLAYLASATILTPGLWLDPLGPLVKVVPAILLAVVARAILDER